MRSKNSGFIGIYHYLLLFVIAFGVIAIIASGGGGDGGDNNDNDGNQTGNAPVISNLTYYPRSIPVNTGYGEALFTYSFDFVDSDGDISTDTLSVFDSNYNLIDTYTDPDEDIVWGDSGTLDVETYVDTTVLGKYFFEVYLTDKTNLASNKLTGTLFINDCWKIKTSMPTAQYGTAISLDEKIYVIGGHVGVSPAWDSLVYDTVSDAWAKISATTLHRCFLTASVVNGKIYAIGGLGDNGTSEEMNEEYDPETDMWTTKLSMPTTRWNLASGVVNNKIYAIGGIHRGEIMDTAASSDVVEEYDPEMDEWTTKAPMPTARHNVAVVAVNNKIYAIGGIYMEGLMPTESGPPYDVVEEYDPEMDEWITKTPMPTPRRNFAAAVVNGKIYAIGGYTSDEDIPSDVVEEYDPLTDTWTSKTPMPTARVNVTASTVNDKIYAIGGISSYFTPSVINNVEEYDPSKDQ